MKVTDYIIEYVINEGVTDIFGYPGGVICHFMDSATKYSSDINMHINYHEQAAAFAACGYAQEKCDVGVAFSTSGPGATNLVTGIANAYFDSIPVVFFTGQVDTYGLKGNLPIRQRGFQETDMISIVDSITKYAVRVDDPKNIKYELDKAFSMAKEGNPGPVLVDLPADVQRADIDVNNLMGFKKQENRADLSGTVDFILNKIMESKRPCLLIGNGVKQSGCKKLLERFVNIMEIPTVFSMPAFDTLAYDNKYNYGFIGANGHRYGNFVLGKADLIICIGSRLDLKQVGNDRSKFASQSNIIRVDIDNNNFKFAVHEHEIQIQADIRVLLPELLNNVSGEFTCSKEWNDVCGQIKKTLEDYDDEVYTCLLKDFAKEMPDNVSVTLDVGQSQVWCAQQIRVKGNQSVHMSAGHGSMGYALPAAIGSYYASRKPVFCYNGDGGIQMNMQELQFLAREKLPVQVVILNNHALGMIRGFQEANFDANYTQTIEGMGYLAPNFERIAHAYGLHYIKIENLNNLNDKININEPSIIELVLPVNTSLNPNFGRNGLIQDQRPYLDRELFDRLMKL